MRKDNCDYKFITRSWAILCTLTDANVKFLIRSFPSFKTNIKIIFKYLKINVQSFKNQPEWFFFCFFSIVLRTKSFFWNILQALESTKYVRLKVACNNRNLKHTNEFVFQFQFLRNNEMKTYVSLHGMGIVTNKIWM